MTIRSAGRAPNLAHRVQPTRWGAEPLRSPDGWPCGRPRFLQRSQGPAWPPRRVAGGMCGVRGCGDHGPSSICRSCEDGIGRSGSPVHQTCLLVGCHGSVTPGPSQTAHAAQSSDECTSSLSTRWPPGRRHDALRNPEIPFTARSARCPNRAHHRDGRCRLRPLGACPERRITSRSASVRRTGGTAHSSE